MSTIKKNPFVLIACTSGIIIFIYMMLVSDLVMFGIFIPFFEDNFKMAAKITVFTLGGVFIFVAAFGWIALKNKEKILIVGMFLILSFFSYSALLNIDNFALINVPGPSTVSKVPFDCVNVLPCETMNGTIDTCICKSDSLRFNKDILTSLHFDSLGHASVFADSQWIMIDKEGVIILAGIAAADNGPDYTSDNRMRFRKDGKWGYANENGVVIIPAIFDGAMPFEDGIASVCVGCKVNYEGEYMLFDGGRKFSIDTLGNVIRKKQTQ
jgi:WG containing repeat